MIDIDSRLRMGRAITARKCVRECALDHAERRLAGDPRPSRALT